MPLSVLLVFTVLLWGSTPLLEKLALRGAAPLNVLWIRTAFITVCGLAAATATGQIGQVARMEGRTLLFTLLSGLTGGVLGLTAYFHALQKGHASLVVPLTATYPLVTVVLSILLLGEPVTPVKIAGVILIVAGVMLVS